MTPIISVQCIGKRFRVGRRAASYGTLRESLSRVARAPVDRFRRGRSAVAAGLARDDADWVWALRDVSFEIQPGEVVGVIGRNGAGKSTLLKVLSRITEPSTGHAELRGRVGSLLEVGTGFHPELTGRENIFLNGAILGMGRREIARKFDAIVAFAEVERFLDTPVKHYSSGMYVRLAFAVAAYLEPEILVVDEVLAVGDAEFQKKCMGKMGEVGREGRTVLLVSHNMASVVNLCRRGILLDAGRVVSDGPVEGVVRDYLATVRTTGGEAVWADPATAPGNHVARLLAVRLFQEGAAGPTADIDISKEVEVRLTYQNYQDGALLYPAVWLRDQVGTVVLVSSNHGSISSTHDPWDAREHPPGLYESSVRIPANFLNDGRYSVTAIVGKGVSESQAFVDHAVSFDVHDTGEMRKEYFGKFLGCVRPRLAWSSTLLDSARGVSERV